MAPKDPLLSSIMAPMATIILPLAPIVAPMERFGTINGTMRNNKLLYGNIVFVLSESSINTNDSENWKLQWQQIFCIISTKYSFTISPE